MPACETFDMKVIIRRVDEDLEIIGLAGEKSKYFTRHQIFITTPELTPHTRPNIFFTLPHKIFLSFVQI